MYKKTHVKDRHHFETQQKKWKMEMISNT